MWSFRVVVLPPLLDQYLCLAEAVEDFSIQHFIAKAGIEAFAITILPGRSGLDASRFCTDGADPVTNGLGDELRAIVGAVNRRAKLTHLGGL